MGSAVCFSPILRGQKLLVDLSLSLSHVLHAPSLVHTGKTLTGDDATLGALKLKNKSKLLLLANTEPPKEDPTNAALADIRKQVEGIEKDLAETAGELDEGVLKVRGEGRGSSSAARQAAPVWFFCCTSPMFFPDAHPHTTTTLGFSARGAPEGSAQEAGAPGKGQHRDARATDAGAGRSAHHSGHDGAPHQAEAAHRQN